MKVRQRLNERFWKVVILALATMPLCSNAQTGFEGSVSMTMQVKDQTIPVTYALKGHKARIEMQTLGRTNVILMDLDTSTETILIPELKAYAVHLSAKPVAAAAKPPKITALGKTETVAGYTCQDYSLESEKYSGTACMSKEFGDNPMADAMSGPLGGALGGDQALKEAGMPLKINLTFRDGEKAGDTAKAEVTKVTPGPQDDAEFSVPEGWHKLSGLPGMQ